MRGQIAGLRANFRPKRADLELERADSGPERADFRPERVDFRPERAWGGRTEGRTNKSPPVFYKTSFPSGPLPKSVRWSVVPDALEFLGSGPEGNEVL